MNNLIFYIVFLVIAINMVGCQEAKKTTNNSNLYPISSLTSEVKPTNPDPQPTFTLSPTPTEATWAEQDSILYIFHDGYLTVDDLNTNDRTKVTYPVDCQSGLIPQHRLMVCNNEQEYFLLDPITKSRVSIDLPETVDFLRTSPDGDYILGSESVDGKLRLFVHNILTAANNYLREVVQQKKLHTVPVLSKNAEYIAFISSDDTNSTEIITMNMANSESQAFVIKKGEIATLFNWSPTQNILIVGASDLETDMPGIMNFLYLVDLDKGSISLLSEAEREHPYEYIDMASSSNIWSPDGQKIVISTPGGLCRVNIMDGDQKCVMLVGAEQYIKSVDWSKNGGNVVAVITTKDDADNAYLITSDYLFVMAMENIPAMRIDIINWR